MKTFYAKVIKRAFDCVIAGLVLLLFCWVYAILAILVRCKLGSPIIFCQKRPGKDGKIFKLHKFRTMTDARDENGALLPDDVRLTKFGKTLRSLSLDELPEFWDIFIGKMSFIGPRPLLTKYLPRYTPEQMRRHEVLPGLTGYAQAHGRNSLTWEEKFEKDVYYVDHISFWLDIKIVCKTFVTVLKRDGISSETLATMEEFMGTEKEQSHV